MSDEAPTCPEHGGEWLHSGPYFRDGNGGWRHAELDELDDIYVEDREYIDATGFECGCVYEIDSGEPLRTNPEDR